ncbi:chorismate--pyruvate lyase family protein [Atopomonas sediminilitoris]|uniref:chorismate--pyruvate lyase family protein n=1 Tax=Atopomonas sediminilitoris TaxID=2919919 RepID=UPI001F4DB97E|nr:chorismate lyase [Atopomonas sediminilitoris]MCJ8168182.1 chorismate lyase [Atopomonas sediminilitoris]
MSSCRPLIWHLPNQLHPGPTPSERDWLLDQGSLTRRLQALAAGEFRVEPLQEGWQSLRADEARALGVATGSQGWVREVLLRGREQPWVFARSVASHEALRGSGFDLAHLGSRSLGELLFTSPAFQRGAIELAHYPSAWLPSAVRTEQLWARRSRFDRERLSLLVCEVFLPALSRQL